MGVLISFKDGTERTLDDALLAERNNRELSQREPTKLHTPIKFVDGMCPVVFDANDLDAYVAGPDVRRDRKHIVKAQEHNLRILKVCGEVEDYATLRITLKKMHRAVFTTQSKVRGEVLADLAKMHPAVVRGVFGCVEVKGAVVNRVESLPPNLRGAFVHAQLTSSPLEQYGYRFGNIDHFAAVAKLVPPRAFANLRTIDIKHAATDGGLVARGPVSDPDGANESARLDGELVCRAVAAATNINALRLAGVDLRGLRAKPIDRLDLYLEDVRIGSDELVEFMRGVRSVYVQMRFMRLPDDFLESACELVAKDGDDTDNSFTMFSVESVEFSHGACAEFMDRYRDTKGDDHIRVWRSGVQPVSERSLHEYLAHFA